MRAIVSKGTPPFAYSWEPHTALSDPYIPNAYAAPTSTTQYILTVTDANGCEARDTVIVFVRPAVYASAGADAELCLGESIELDGAASGGEAPFSFAWSPAAGLSDPAARRPTASPPASTAYVLTVTDANGCRARDTVLVTVLEPPEARAGADTSVCLGSALRLGLAPRGGSPPYNWKWSPADDLDDASSPFPLASPSATTRFALQVTDSKGCIGRDTITVYVNIPPKADAGGNIVLCEGRSIAIGGEALGGAPPFSYKWSPAAGLSSTTVASPIASPRSTTLYRVTVTDANGCSSGDSALVIVAENPRVSAVDSVIVCAGDAAELLATAEGGLAPYNYEWSPEGSVLLPFERRTPAFPSKSMTYRVRVTDANGCTGEDSVRVVVLAAPAPRITALGGTVFCLGDSVTLQADPGYVRYLWRFPAGDSSSARTVIARSGGMHRVEVWNKDGCRGSDSVLITATPGFTLLVQATGALSFCEGDSVELIAASGYRDYEWKSEQDGLVGLGRSLMVKRTGRFVATARDSLGCAGLSELVTVTVHALPEPRISGPVSTCANGRSVYAAAETPGRKYLWRASGGAIEDGQGSRRVTVRWGASGSGTIELIETVDSSGCEGGTLLAVNIGTSLEPRISGPNAICEGDTAYLDAGEGYATYEWKDGSGNTIYDGRILAVVTSGSYSVRVSDEDGCTGTSTSHLLAVRPAPRPQITGATSFCSGDTIYLGTGGQYAAYAWRLGDTLLGNGSRIAATRGGVYALEVTDTNGCRGATQISVRENPRPEPLVTGPSALCEGDTVYLDGSEGYASYEWKDGAGNECGRGRYLAPAVSGTYTVTVRDTAGCEGTSAGHRVEVYARPAARITGPSSACIGRTSLFFVSASPGSSIDWAMTNGTVTGPTDRDTVEVRWDIAGTAVIVVTLTNPACSASDTIVVEVGSSLRVVIAGPTRICDGDTAVLDAGLGYAAYLWRLPGGGELNTRSIAVTESGGYQVTVSDDAGCEGSATHTLTVLPRPAPVIAGPSHFCEGDTILLDAGDGYVAYEWRDAAGRSLSAARYLGVSEGGSYSVQVTDVDGCTGASSPHEVTVHPLPPRPVITMSGDTLRSTPAAAYSWMRNDTLLAGAAQQYIAHPEPGRYTVRITDENGCVNTSNPYDYAPAAIAAAVIALPYLEAAPGERVELPIILQSSENLDHAKPDGFTATLRFDSRLLVPIDSTPMGVIDGNDRIIRLVNTGYWELGTGYPVPGSQSAIIILPFLATLGSVETTTLRFDAFTFTLTGREAPVRVSTLAGEFRLTICREGGARLFDGGARFYLGQNSPNPFNSQTAIEYGIMEAGHARLSVFDMLGRELSVIVDAHREPGSYRALFDAALLSSGMYACVLRSGSGVLVRWMVVGK